MKTHEPITQLEELNINADARRFLKETSKWSFFIGVLGVVGIVFMIFGGLLSSFIFNSLPQQPSTALPIDMGSVMTVFYLLLALLYVFPIYYLLQFSIKLKKALTTKEDAILADAFQMLKSHYKFIGVLCIIVISLNILTIIAVALGAFAFL